jgi:hypothetical protein
MERYSSTPQQRMPGRPVQRPETEETFSEVAEATAHERGFVGKLLVLSLIVVSVAVTAFVGYMIVRGVGSQSSIDKEAYQAVFLDDGQIYFGKLSGIDQQYSKLESIYYLQVTDKATGQPVQQGSSNPTQIVLQKLGNEIHGPQDSMFINTDKILFWENLKVDGQVTKAIEKYLADKASGANTTDTTTTETDTTTDTTTPVIP